MIAPDEPTELSHTPQAFVFQHRVGDGVTYSQTAFVSKSIRREPALVAFEGSLGRVWLFDPCSAALWSGLHAARLAENSADQLARAARRKAKAQLASEEVKARSIKSTSW